MIPSPTIAARVARRLVLAVLVGLPACGLFGPREVSSINASADSAASFGSLPDVVLLDAKGEAVGPGRLRGSTWALALLSRPIRFQTRAMSEALGQLSTALEGTDLRLVSLSLDPLEDTPESLAGYAEKVGADSDTWMLWTGPEPSVYRLMQAAYRSVLVDVAEVEMEAIMERSFESHVVVIDAEGRVRGAYDLFADGGPAAILNRLRAVARE